MTATDEYQTSYDHGYEAGRVYLWPAEWRTVHRNDAGRYQFTGHGTMHPAAAAGWMRGFRHGCMDAK